MSNRKTALLFGIHMHQPVDNFKEVINGGVHKCYGPFFEVMSRYPEFHFSVHCSGWLLEQIEKFHPKLFSQMKKLADKGSLEFFSAGYYEPILSVIPSVDRVAQIKKLNTTIEKKFGVKAKGMWLTERVWESALIPDLKEAGIEYTVLDDYHFQCTGFNESELDSHYMTEEGGHELGLFPISKKLRYALPFMSVESAVETVKSINYANNSAAIIFDDAEKFGMWPGTYEWVYEKKWLEKFVETVLEDEKIEPLHFSEYYESNKPKGIAYLPNVSYFEMGEWSLKADDAAKLEEFKEHMGHDNFDKDGIKFLKGGIWKNFFVKYDESNRIHKRMLELSHTQKNTQNSKFKDYLYKFQTNDVLWHGVFGGLYLPNLRDNAYRFLIGAENERYGSSTVIEIDKKSIDGYIKVKSIGKEYILRFDEKASGQLIEFDSRSDMFNWQNCLTRRKESYHAKILEETKHEEHEPLVDGIDTIHAMAFDVSDELKDSLTYDWYVKNSFIDHITDDSFTLASFRHCNFHEYGDFANQPFKYKSSGKKIQFERYGGIFLPHKESSELSKSFKPRDSGFDFSVQFSTSSQRLFTYAMELNFHFADHNHLLINGYGVSDGGMIEGVKKIELIDTYLDKSITISVDERVNFLYYPLKTVSQSEMGFDLTTQQISMAFLLPFAKSFTIKGSIEVHNV